MFNLILDPTAATSLVLDPSASHWLVLVVGGLGPKYPETGLITYAGLAGDLALERLTGLLVSLEMAGNWQRTNLTGLCSVVEA